VIGNAASAGFPVNASCILLFDALLMFRTKTDRLFAVSPAVRGLLNCTIMYGGVTTAGREGLRLLNGILLERGNVSLGEGDSWRFCISRVSEASDQCLETESAHGQSIVVTVPSEGNYSISAFDGSVSGLLSPEFDQLDCFGNCQQDGRSGIG
jgi:hypothetical protein